MTHQILADDDNCHARRSHVLLRAAVDNAVLGEINRLGHDVGGHICYHRNLAGLRIVVPLGAEDRVVGADIEVIRLRIEVKLLLLRNPSEVIRLRGCSDMDLAVLLCFLIGTACEIAGDRVVRLAGDHQVERDCGELHGCTALHEQDLIVVWNIHNAAECILRTVDDIIVIL